MLSGLNVSTLQLGLSLWKLKASQLRHKHGLVSTSLSVDAAAIEKLGSSRNQSVEFRKHRASAPQFPGIASAHVSNQRYDDKLLKAASNSSSVNCALHTEAVVDGLGKNYANLQAVVKICQLFI